MRLFQLARKLEVAPESIISLLADHDIAIENKSNIKLEEEQIAIVLNHFEKADVFGEQEKLQKEGDLELEPMMDEPPIDEEILLPAEPSLNDQPSIAATEGSVDDAGEKEKEIEVIRVKKIKLSGPKVVGKIDLPEPVKKEKTSKEQDSEPSQKRGHSRGRNRDRWSRGNKRKETLEQKRQREAREKEKSKKQQEKLKKEQRKKFYVENIQATPVLHPPKKRVKRTEQSLPPGKKQVAKHKNPFRRLWSWLNGEYDQY